MDDSNGSTTNTNTIPANPTPPAVTPAPAASVPAAAKAEEKPAKKKRVRKPRAPKKNTVAKKVADKEQAPATAATEGNSDMSKAVIACKLPNGLTIDHKGKTVTLLGANDRKAFFGFGMTRGVDMDWFNDWVELNREFPPIKRGSIFIAPTIDHGEDMANERKNDASVRTGQEPLDPDKPGPGLERAASPGE